ncbi:hypothetical protein FKR81_08775 [Lentzea tibetensis]|uniref:Uncharacterized protein n=1 Tax=Lentzea tibetensis TaxID=2591470 RepID=A0A563EY60_9PSEU|nr:hypothetical protein [Lentzea tibetensis]TWP52421.1 hypothetical protein FKR81_08775 [Lentzea tibetensis]
MGKGERLDASFTKVADAAGTPRHDLVVGVRGPGGVAARCRVDDVAPVRSGCGWAGLTSSASGIWVVDVDIPGAGCPVVGTCAGRDGFRWAVAVRRGTELLPGRVWTERYEISRDTGEPPVDLTFWYQGEYGYTYRATFREHHGVDWAVAADNLGVVRDFTCTPVHASSDRLPAADGWCGGAYKVFFEPPAADLPAEAVRWDGVLDWVRPGLRPHPVISGGRFTPAGGRSGTLAFELADYSGHLVVRVEAGGDGVDRSIPITTREGTVEVFFDGLGGDGAPLPQSAPVVFEVLVERIAEIHFVSADVEVRAGGIEVTRLNGAEGGERTLHWDDTPFDRRGPRRCSGTPVLDGRAGHDSAGGVHGWGIGGCGSVAGADADDHVSGGWGDARVVDDWAYLPVRVTHAVVLP